jgi:hypothetical protein
MEDIEKVTVSQHETYVLGHKLFLFDISIKFETYQNDWYYGIIFIIENEGDGLMSPHARYDVVHHYHMDWERLIINNKGGWKDVPFYHGTFDMLPEGVKVIEL